MFRVPSYIAIRFNLKITNVYRGILLGTGPIIDPGFVGRLSLPLHNLTLNQYEFTGGEGLIWMEFTKISPSAAWTAPLTSRSVPPLKGGRVFDMPVEKADPAHDVEYYLNKTGAPSIRSSIPEAAAQANTKAIQASNAASASRREVARARQIVAGLGVLTVVTIVLGLTGIVLATFQLVSGVDGRLDSLSDRLASLQAQATARASAPTKRPAQSMAPFSAQLAKLDHKIDSVRQLGLWWFVILTAMLIVTAVTMVCYCHRPIEVSGPGSELSEPGSPEGPDRDT
jgi:hypothetical protein